MQKHHSIIPLEIENMSLNSKKSRYTYLKNQGIPIKKIMAGSMRNFCAARPHFPQENGKNHRVPRQIFSIPEKCLLRPRNL
ncbi:MAG: hypothetical protein SPF46_11345, partial [Blautia sp.]|nr:hypothetical protein [Blautia sp.]